jgi:hypothetical protein
LAAVLARARGARQAIVRRARTWPVGVRQPVRPGVVPGYLGFWCTGGFSSPIRWRCESREARRVRGDHPGPELAKNCSRTQAGAAGPTLTPAVSKLGPVRLRPSRTEWAEGRLSVSGATPPDYASRRRCVNRAEQDARRTVLRKTRTLHGHATTVVALRPSVRSQTPRGGSMR